MVAFRTGLSTPAFSYTIGPAILVCTVLGLTLWASRAPGRLKRIGPLAIAVLLASFVLVAFGIVLQVQVFAAALFLLARGLLTIGRPTLLPGLPPNAFEHGVVAGTFPQPIRLASVIGRK